MSKYLHPGVNYSVLSEDERKNKSIVDLYTVFYLTGNCGLTDLQVAHVAKQMGKTGYESLTPDASVRSAIFRWNRMNSPRYIHGQLVGKERVVRSAKVKGESKCRYYLHPDFARVVFPGRPLPQFTVATDRVYTKPVIRRNSNNRGKKVKMPELAKKTRRGAASEPSMADAKGKCVECMETENVGLENAPLGNVGLESGLGNIDKGPEFPFEKLDDYLLLPGNALNINVLGEWNDGKVDGIGDVERVDDGGVELYNDAELDSLLGAIVEC